MSDALVFTWNCLKIKHASQLRLKYYLFLFFPPHRFERSNNVRLFLIMCVSVKFTELSGSANTWPELDCGCQRFTNKRPHCAARWGTHNHDLMGVCEQKCTLFHLYFLVKQAVKVAVGWEVCSLWAWLVWMWATPPWRWSLDICLHCAG